MQLSTNSLKLIAPIRHSDTTVSSALPSSQQQKQSDALIEKAEKSSLDDILMSRYNLRSRQTLPSDTSVSEKSETSNSSSRPNPNRRRSLPTPGSNSPYFLGFAPYFIPSYGIMATEDQINAVSTSQDNLDAYGTEQDAQNFMAANSLGQSPEQVISVIDSTYKRNQINYFLARIKGDINGIKDALLDQIAAPIIEEEFQDIVEMLKTYNKAVTPLLDLPEDPTRDAGVNDFINSHRDEHKSLNQEVKSMKLRVQRLLTMDAMRAVQNSTHHPGAKVTNSQSALKLPRIQIPRFEDNKSGSLDWENFKTMLLKLTAEMASEQKIFVLKSALTGDSSKLIANENDYDQALSMLSSVYGNELLQS